jgi:transposase
MYRIRIVKTSSNASAVQVVRYENRKRIIFKHIGSAHNEEELKALKAIARKVIEDASKQIALFEEQHSSNKFLYLEKSNFLGVYYTFLYDAIISICERIGFGRIINDFLTDLVVIRIIEPASKLRSVELIAEYFGIKHRRQNYYKVVPQWLALKSDIEEIVTSFARKEYAFDYNLLFYDVTTLYFETFDEDGLRKQGFSKDNRPQQPQILVGLMVTKEGFPISYEIFTGNTFEGHTILPVVKSFIKKHQVNNFTVVADAAMISTDNIDALKQSNIHYIVGARLANLSVSLIDKIDKQICREDGSLIRIQTDNGYLICSFSNARYRKDRYEMLKQIEKAKQAIKQPSKNKRLKFTKSNNEKLDLNQSLIDKTEKLLGIKGYYTDLNESEVPSKMIVDRYHELYKIEQAFRMSKHDLKSRPIYHYKDEPIQLHMLICFMALATSKHIELKSGKSLKRFLSECKKIQDARMLDKSTNVELRIRKDYTPEVWEFIQKLDLPH